MSSVDFQEHYEKMKKKRKKSECVSYKSSESAQRDIKKYSIG
jgi:hypothetical protein